MDCFSWTDVPLPALDVEEDVDCSGCLNGLTQVTDLVLRSWPACLLFLL